ncbi:MAG: hypothetical protein ACR2GX_03455 [Candidatus Dormibacteria bacterium]
MAENVIGEGGGVGAGVGATLAGAVGGAGDGVATGVGSGCGVWATGAGLGTGATAAPLPRVAMKRTPAPSSTATMAAMMARRQRPFHAAFIPGEGGMSCSVFGSRW